MERGAKLSSHIPDAFAPPLSPPRPDEEYIPVGRSRSMRRNAVAERAGSATTIPSPSPSPTRSAFAAMPSAAAAAGRWADRIAVCGPCMNPDCEHPTQSPQWRKGPPQFPVLCNACGTRWLRNGTLKPLVVSIKRVLLLLVAPCGHQGGTRTSFLPVLAECICCLCPLLTVSPYPLLAAFAHC
jgi:hypothetical protein